ncbi:MAG: hypothetical protein DME45_01910 [Verrucomicrobia bacterium]|nr:MAG: hypothetical protein DME45_01910 [Verrucomicrobiota bacterium]
MPLLMFISLSEPVVREAFSVPKPTASFRKAGRVHAVPDAPKLFTERQEGIEMATKSALTV